MLRASLIQGYLFSSLLYITLPLHCLPLLYLYSTSILLDLYSTLCLHYSTSSLLYLCTILPLHYCTSTLLYPTSTLPYPTSTLLCLYFYSTSTLLSTPIVLKSTKFSCSTVQTLSCCSGRNCSILFCFLMRCVICLQHRHGRM